MFSGASRKASASRDGGVSTTSRSNSPVAWSSNSRSMAMYSWLFANRPVMLR